MKRVTFNVYVTVKENGVTDQIINLTDAIAKQNVVVFPNGSSVGGAQCVVLQAYRPSQDRLTVKLWNPSTVTIPNSTRQGYVAYFF